MGLEQSFDHGEQFDDDALAEFNARLAELKQAGDPKKLADFVNVLSGSAILSVVGKVYPPTRLTKAFGDWIVGVRGQTFGRFEMVETRPDVWQLPPPQRPHLAFKLRSARVHDGRALVEAEYYCEGGTPILFFADETGFSIEEFHFRNELDERDERHIQGVLRASRGFSD